MALDEFSPEILHQIISHLSFSERRYLKQCSKLLNEASQRGPVIFEEVKFTDGYYSQNSMEYYFIKLQLNGIELNFRESENDESNPTNTTMNVFVDNVQHANKTRIFEKSKAIDTAKQFLRKLVVQNNVTCGCFETNYRYTEHFLEDSEFIRSRKLRITMPAHEVSAAPTDKWLKHMKPEIIRFVNVYKANQFFSVIGCERQLRSLKTLHVIQRSDIDDHVVISLTAFDVELEPARITHAGVNTVINKWKTEAVPLRSQFVYYPDDPSEFPLEQLVINIQNVMYKTPEIAIIPISSDRVLRVLVDQSSVNVACMKNLSE